MGRTIVKSEGRRHSKQAGVDILISVTAVRVGSKLLVRSYSDHVLMWQGTKCGNRYCRGGVMLLYKHCTVKNFICNLELIVEVR